MTSSKPTTESTTLMDQQDSPQDCQSVEMEPPVRAEKPEKSSQTPFWLTKAALLLFVVIFASCSASLIVLHYFMHARGGLSLKFSSSEYSWTYGPTAVLIIILGLWRRIDYYYKSTQPWVELQSGPVPASRSLLLDYISPFQLQSMYRAFKFGHYRITASIFSFFLLKGIILVSTTLFVVQTSSHNGTFDITYENTFDVAKTWTSYPFIEENDLLDYQPIFENGSNKAIWNYLARLNDAVPSDPAWKIQGGLVSQQFRPAESVLNITYLEAPVEVFVPNITCEDATLTVDLHNPQMANYSWNSPTCSTVVSESPYHCSNDPSTGTLCGEKPWLYSFLRVNCSRGIKTMYDSYSDNLPHSIEEYDIRHVFTAAQYSNDMEVHEQGVSESLKLIDYSSIICKIGYSIVSTNATNNPLSGDTRISTAALKGGGTTLRNLTSPYLAEILLYNLQSSAGALVANKTITTQSLTGDKTMWGQAEALVQLMAVRMEDNFELRIFLNSTVFRNTVIAVLNELLNEIARELLLVNGASKGTAYGVVSEHRLYTRAEAVWAMTAGFGLLAAICLLLFFTTSTKLWTHAFCGSISGHGVILANSIILQNLLRDSGHYNERDLVALLNETQFRTATNESGDMSVEMSESSQFMGAKASEDDSEATTRCCHIGRHGRLQALHGDKTAKARAWVPLTGSLPFVIATIAFPILAIGILELLHKLSNERQGLIDMHENDSTALSYIARIASTAAVFTIATMFNSLDSTIATFAPYSALRSGNIQADKSVLFHLLSISPFLVIVRTFGAGYFGAGISNLSTLLGSCLTIVVSGIWILTGNVLLLKPSSAMITNWNSTWHINTVDDGGAAMTLNLVRHGGANISLGIWKDVVIPDIELSASHTPTSDIVYRSSNHTYKVGALRPFLKCTAVPWRNVRNERKHGHTNISAHFLAPYSCGHVKVNKVANISFGFSIRDRFLTYQYGGAENAISGWIGRYMDLNTTTSTSDAKCPSVGILFGKAGGADPSEWNLTALVCSQGIEQIPVDVTYKGNPALRQINEQIPPKLERDKAWRWINKTSKSQTLGYRLQRFLTSDLAFFQVPHDDNTYVDPFIDQLIYGPNGLKKEDLVGPTNVDNLIQAVERDYAEYMRVVIDRNFRATKNTTSELISAEAFPSKTSPSSWKSKISGTSYEYGTRLAIHSTSKLILQILLAAMAVLGLVSYLLVKIDGTLPRNPCSIASTMAFLAGSHLCDPSSGIIPKGAEYMSDKELAKVFDGWVFSLGWWHTQRSSAVESSGSDDMDVTGSEQEDGAEPTREVSKRFGVDVGCADVSKF